ncbi:MAG TPA: UGSC family (seleno)protein, partial [Gammaproteobacteria bacterium]|nr:UGSC family (seleno)protein [Gammaproteobacteria bacterium]
MPIVTSSFITLAKTNAARHGMPLQRVTFVPHPVWGKSAEKLHEVIRGNDPDSGKPIMPQI